MPSLIVKVIQRYYTDWEPPEQMGRDWVAVRCPFHGDNVKSAGISFKHDAFRCLGCGFGGSAVRILSIKEGVTIAAAKRIAAQLLGGSDEQIPQEPARKPRRRVFGDTGLDGSEHQGGSQQVPTGIRGRSTPWT